MSKIVWLLCILVSIPNARIRACKDGAQVSRGIQRHSRDVAETWLKHINDSRDTDVDAYIYVVHVNTRTSTHVVRHTSEEALTRISVCINAYQVKVARLKLQLKEAHLERDDAIHKERKERNEVCARATLALFATWNHHGGECKSV
jgi:hypothetical protein